MDAATFVVEMIDKVSGPSFKASKAVDNLNKQLKKTGTLAPSRKDMMAGGIGPIDPRAVARLTRSNLALLAKSRLGEPVVAGIDKGVDKAADSLLRFGKYAAIGLGAAGIAAGTYLVKGTLHMASFAEATMIAFKSLTGSSEAANAAWQKSLTLSRQLGLGFEETAGSMKHLLAMQFTLSEAEELVKISADLKAVTGDAQATERALRAITQIKAKGRLQSEELVGQLAEAGVSTVLVYEELGKMMGKNRDQVRKLITAGNVDSDTGITAIKRAILRKTHSTEAGTAGTARAQTTFEGLVDQLKQAPTLLFVRLADQVKANLDKFRPAVQKVIEAIDRVQGDQMARFVGNALQFVERLVPLSLEFAAGFGEGFAAMNDALGALDPSQASLKTAREIGRTMADAFGVVLKVLKQIADILIWLDQNRGMAKAIAVSLLATRALGAGLVGKGLWSGGKLLVRGGVALAGMAGVGGAATAAGTTAAAGAAGAGAAGAATAGAGAAAAGVAGTTAAVGAGTAAGAGTTGGAALAAGLGVAGAVAAAAAGVGLGAATAGYVWREEIAKWMYGTRNDQATQRGLGETTPTPMLIGMQRAANRQTNTNVQMHTTVNVDGSNKDAGQIGKDIAESQRDGLEQFFQSQALEAGAM